MPKAKSPESVSHTAELFDAKLLRLFDLLHHTGSVTRAAEELGLSQPTISIWLSKLRTQFNDQLFVRTSEGMQPTPRADALIGTVRTALESFRQLSASEPVFNPASADRKFRICMTDASHITLLPQLLSHVRARAPKVRLDAARIDADMPLALQTGDADIAIGLVPQLEAGFYQQTLFTQDWVCLANKEHPRIGKTFTLKQYKEESHILIAAGTGAMLQSEALKQQRINRRVLLELPGFLGLPAILATTDLIVTLPRHIGETLARLGGLKVLECPVNIPSFQVKQHWHARYHNDPANRWLRGLCADLFLKTGRNKMLAT
jgi:DNA-binding transcriptional LysR family regulator